MNSASWVGARAISGLTRVGILLAIARIYGPQSFGELSFAISLVEILRSFSEFGIDTISIRRFVQADVERRRELLKVILGARLLLGAVFYSVGAAVLFVFTKNHVQLWMGAVAGLSLFFAGVLGALSSYFQSSFSISRILRSTLVSSAGSIAFVVAGMYGHVSIVLVLASLPLADGLNVLLLWLRSEAPLRIRFDLRQTVALLRESLPLGFVAIFVILYFRLDNLFVFKFAGDLALGLYAICYRIVEPSLMVPSAFSATTYTLLSRAEHQETNVSEIARIVYRTMWPAYAFIAAVVTMLLFGGKLLLGRFFPGYSGAYPILVVLVFALAVRTFGITLATVLNSRGKYSTLAKLTGVSLLANLLLVVVLVPSWGALGAAWAALLTEVLNALMQSRGVLASLLPVSGPLVVGNLNIE